MILLSMILQTPTPEGIYISPEIAQAIQAIWALISEWGGIILTGGATILKFQYDKRNVERKLASQKADLRSEQEEQNLENQRIFTITIERQQQQIDHVTERLGEVETERDSLKLQVQDLSGKVTALNKELLELKPLSGDVQSLRQQIIDMKKSHEVEIKRLNTEIEKRNRIIAELRGKLQS